MSTLSEQIYHELYANIIEQRLPCGQKLTLKMLKERFSVSHTPIREALVRLSENGLVTYYSNCGVTVTEFTEDDISKLYQFAAEIDALAIQFCKRLFNHMPLILDLQEAVEECSRALEERDLVRWKKHSERFHTVFYCHAQNPYLDEAASRMRAKLELLSHMYTTEQNVGKIHDGHVKIFDSIQDGKFDIAANRMRQHLQYDMAYALKAYGNRGR